MAVSIVSTTIENNLALTAKSTMGLKLLLSTLCLHYPNPCDAYVSYFQVVSSTVYLKELEKLGINVNAKNFLVFQVQKASQ